MKRRETAVAPHIAVVGLHQSRQMNCCSLILRKTCHTSKIRPPSSSIHLLKPQDFSSQSFHFSRMLRESSNNAGITPDGRTSASAVSYTYAAVLHCIRQSVRFGSLVLLEQRGHPTAGAPLGGNGLRIGFVSYGRFRHAPVEESFANTSAVFRANCCQPRVPIREGCTPSVAQVSGVQACKEGDGCKMLTLDMILPVCAMCRKRLNGCQQLA